MVRRRFFHTVVFRLIVGLALSGLVLSAGLALLQVRAAESAVQADVTQRIVLTTFNIQSIIRGLLDSHSDDRVREALTLFTANSQVRAGRLIRPDAKPIEVGVWPADLDRHVKLWPIDQNAMTKGGGVDLERLTLLEAPFRHDGQGLMLQLLIDGPGVARQSRARIWGGLSSEWTFLAFITLLGMLAMRRIVTGPLARVVELVRANAGAEPFRRLAATGRDEFGLLAEAIGGMLAQVESTAAQLRQSQAAFQSLFEDAPAAMISLDPQGLIIAANHRAAEVLGAVSEAALVGRAGLDFICTEDRPMLRQTLERLPLKGISHCELRLTAERGRPEVLVKCVADRGQDGELQSVRLSIFDVSESKQLQRQLGDRTRLLDLILNHISDAILLVDVDGHVAAYNRQLAALVHARADDLTGTRYDPDTFWDELGVIEKLQFLERLRQIDAERDRPAQERFITRSGNFLFQSIPVHDPTGQPLGRLWVVQETTAQDQGQRLLEQQAAQLRAVREVSRELSDVADVNTLMTRAGEHLYAAFQIEAVGLALRRDEGGSRSRQIIHRGNGSLLLEANRDLIAAVERHLMPQILSGQEVAFWPDLSRGTEWGQAFLRAGLTCVAAGPVRGSADAQGILWIARRGGEHMERQHLFLLEALAPMVAARLEIAQLRERLNALELTDLTTQLPNHRQLLFEVGKLVHRPGYPWSLVLLNIDHFRDLNARLDHEAADHLLRNVAHALQQATRKSTLVARITGSTFAVLNPGGTRAQTLALADRLRQIIRQQAVTLPGISGGERHELTASVGVACCPEDGADESLIELALSRVQAAKKAGRDRVVADGPAEPVAAG